ncbi:MAG: DNA polymerase III subunit gamma/tau [Polaribacter sp. BACL8 MAG-120531-bin13]|nr:MAG: DNA polymerase III subunit gamma/tau [Polaribacter sp. BACL8 MAG-120531-bin13]KRP01631.1 MAG: DNA polymerase III subunit gamma/tau [Polaribacter sp. BACL8 MAG-120619-bin41]KRP14884.1 MAG: DNA polymerase III subunit gamma/tau [Polaribacter sp. BACL8 MAG-120419-bin8]
MEPFLVSARKYRPLNFEDVVGQSAITNTLEKSIDNNHLAQALLFCGPRGVGKTSCARILAKKINEKELGTSTEEDYAFNIFELDAASNNSVDDIRNLVDQVRIPPQKGAYKVYIIDEVHMLSTAAFNAFLKTLEEPPKHAIFILATTEKHKIIPTILSRCQIYDFKRITVTDMALHLGKIAADQGITAHPDALHLIAQKADGALRDALSIFDRIVSYTGENLSRQAVSENLNILDYDTYFAATDFMLTGDIPSSLLLFNDCLSLGFDGHHFIQGLAAHLRDLMLAQFPATISLMEVGEETKQRYESQAKQTPPAFLLGAIDIANHCDLQFKNAKNQRLLVELAIMKIASMLSGVEKKNRDWTEVITTPIIPTTEFKDHLLKKVVQHPSQNTASVELGVETASVPMVDEAIVETTSAPLIDEAIVETASAPIVDEIPNAESATITEPVSVAPLTKPSLNLERKEGVSGLSIASLKAKKVHEDALKNKVQVDSPIIEDAFTEEILQKHWSDFIEKIEAEGQKIIASNLNADQPKLLDNFVIGITLPNDTMKKEVEKAQSGVLDYLKSKLNNHSISLEVSVLETMDTKYAFTPEEKYEKIRSKNPAVDVLRQSFDLDLQ